MAVGITAAEAAVAIRAATSTDSVDPTVLTVINIVFAAACALVMEYAPKAPDAIHNAAAIRLTGWLYDSDPTDISTAQILRVSGASSVLAQWRVHRAGPIGAGAPGAAVPSGAGLPPIPPSGNFILNAKDGELEWLEFPDPS